MGVMYHGNYAQYLEMGRTEWLRSLGISYKEMEEMGVMLPVISLNISYKKSAYYDDIVFVETKLTNKPTARISFDYEMTNEQGELIATANTVLAFIDMATKRVTRCPDFILHKLNEQG